MEFMTGVNYWPRSSGVQMWSEFSEDEIRKDLKSVAALGMNTVRLFIRWSDFQPSPGEVDESMLERFDLVIDAARVAGVRLAPTFFCGHMSGENWDVPWRGGRDIYEDPTMLRAEMTMVRTFASRYRGENVIAFWDLGNEEDIYLKPKNPDAGWLWVRALASELRLADPTHPVTLGTHISSLWEDCGFRPGDLAESLDFLCMHAYPLYSEACPERMDGVRSTYFVPFCAALTKALGDGQDVLFEEFGATSQMCGEDVIERYYGTTLYSLLASGASGAMGWCYRDFSPEVGKRLPYDTTPYEVGFGVVDAERQPKGAGRAFAEFCSMLRAIGHVEPLDGAGAALHPASREAAIIVPRRYYDNYDADVTPERNFRILFNSYILAMRAGLNPELVTFHDDISKFKIIFLPSVSRRGQINNCDWRRLKDSVEAGATLFMSYDGVALPGMDDVFGLDVRYPVNDGPGAKVTLLPDPDAPPSETAMAVRSMPMLKNPTGRRMVVETRPGCGTGYECGYGRGGDRPDTVGRSGCDSGGAETWWRHADGSAAITCAGFGDGHAVFCDFPLELALAYTPGVYDGWAEWDGRCSEQCSSLSHRTQAGQAGKDATGFDTVYRRVAAISEWREPVVSDCPDISATLLEWVGGCSGAAGDDVLVVVNYAHKSRKASLSFGKDACPRAIADLRSGEELCPDTDGVVNVQVQAGRAGVFLVQGATCPKTQC